MKLDKVIFYIKRLYRNYIKKHLKKIFISLILSLGVAGTTSATAWLLDPAVKKIFIDQDKTYAIFIPILIVIVFSLKGICLYLARAITLVVGHRIQQQIRTEMANNVLLSDTQTLESKHTGKYVSHFLYDVGLIYTLVSSGLLNLMKDTFTLIGLVILMFYQNWKLALFSLIMMPLAAFVAKSLGKRMGKATTESVIHIFQYALFLKFACQTAKHYWPFQF